MLLKLQQTNLEDLEMIYLRLSLMIMEIFHSIFQSVKLSKNTYLELISRLPTTKIITRITHSTLIALQLTQTQPL